MTLIKRMRRIRVSFFGVASALRPAAVLKESVRQPTLCGPLTDGSHRRSNSSLPRCTASVNASYDCSSSAADLLTSRFSRLYK